MMLGKDGLLVLLPAAVFGIYSIISVIEEFIDFVGANNPGKESSSHRSNNPKHCTKNGVI